MKPIPQKEFYFLVTYMTTKNLMVNSLYEGDIDKFIFDLVDAKNTVVNYIAVDKKKWDQWLNEQNSRRLDAQAEAITKTVKNGRVKSR